MGINNTELTARDLLPKESQIMEVDGFEANSIDAVGRATIHFYITIKIPDAHK